MAVPDKESRQRIVSYQAQIVALGILRCRKSQLVIKSAQWRNIYNAHLDTAALERKIADLDRARRDIIIVATTGIFACIGSAVVTGLLARSAGVAYRSGSWAAPVVMTSTAVVIPTGTTLTITGTSALGLTSTQWVLSQIVQTAVIRIPVGQFLARTVGSSALGRFFELVAGKLNQVKYSDAEFQQLRQTILESGIGQDRFRRILSDSGARREELAQAISGTLQEMVAQHVAETLMGIQPPASGLLVMNEGELASWYRKFRTDVDAYIDKQYGSWSREDRNILKYNLYWQFWLDVETQLNSWDRKWHSDIATLNRAIRDEPFSRLWNLRSR